MLLETGNEKLIEEIEAVTLSTIDNYDPLISAGGKRVYPISIVSGLRPEPYVAIEAKRITGFGAIDVMNVRVSANHAFLTASNKIVQARNVAVGTRLRSQYGNAIVEASAYVPNEGLVWNRFVASEEFVRTVLPRLSSSAPAVLPYLANSSLGLSSIDHFIYGNGFLSADLSLQIIVGEAASSGLYFSQLGLME